VGQWLGEIGGRVMCLPGTRCLHEYFSGLNGRCPGGVWCGSQPSF
jgi:hypothetical protein